jgi:hypothetical protein
MPGVQTHPQPCVQNEKARKQVTTGAPNIPAFPARLVLTAYFVLSLVIGLFVTIPGHDAERRHQVDISVEISGPHNFAVRQTTLSSAAQFASIASRAQRS